MKPSDLLLGLRELFGALIPGTIFLYCLPLWIVDGIGGLLAPARSVGPSETVELMVFFALAYAAGTLLSGFGSLLDFVTDKRIWRFDIGSSGEESMRARNIEALALGLRDYALRHVPVPFDRPIWGKRAFWWNYLRVHCPHGVVEIDRLEAQQKLVRSLVAALAILAVLECVAFLHPSIGATIERLSLLLVGTVVCFLPYWQMRRKLTERLFQLAVIQFVGDELHLREKAVYVSGDQT